MNSHEHDTDDRISELESLPRAIAPGAGVEDAVVAALERRGVLRRARPARMWLAAAAVVIAFAGGVLIGRGTAPDAPPATASSPNAQSMPAAPGTTVTWF